MQRYRDIYVAIQYAYRRPKHRDASMHRRTVIQRWQKIVAAVSSGAPSTLISGTGVTANHNSAAMQHAHTAHVEITICLTYVHCILI